MIRFFTTTLLLIMCFRELQATHNLGGSISYKHMSGLTYEITVTTTTDFVGPGVSADRCSLKVYINNSDSLIVLRINGTTNTCPVSGSWDGEIFIRNNHQYKKNIYRGIYTFVPGSHTISMMDPNRNGGITNIGGDSSRQPFWISAGIEINPFTNCPVNSVVCESISVTGAALNNFFSYSPLVKNPDGDSLWFEFVPTMGQFGATIPGYISASSYGATIDHHTGIVYWPAPPMQGQYIYSIKISQYRNGYFIGYVIKDVTVVCQSQGTYSSNFQNTSGNLVMDGQGYYTLHAIPGTSVNFSIDYSCTGITGANMTASTGGAPLGTNILTNVNGDTLTFNCNAWVPSAADARREPYIFSFMVNNTTSANTSFNQAYSILVYIDGLNSPLCPTFGLQKKEEEVLLSVYPSPATDQIECHLTGNVEYNNLAIVNAMGQEVLVHTLNQGEQLATLNLKGIVTGLYFVLIRKDKTIISRKKIIIKS